MPLEIPVNLERACRTTKAGRAWLERLPERVDELRRRWGLRLETPFDGDEVSCSWVASATRADGSSAVLKLPLPHFEAAHEIDGLRFWQGNPTVEVLEFDATLGAALLERCEPGTHLRAAPEPEQDVQIAALLRRLWRRPSEPHRFRPLSALAAHWEHEILARREASGDPGLVGEGLRLFRELSVRRSTDVLLATDLHAGNVLRAQREPWLVIDPKPFLGDPTYDATQHLLNCRARLLDDAERTVRRFSELLEVDHERVRLWTFARLALELGSRSADTDTALVRKLAG